MVGKICSRPVVTVRPDNPVQEAARLMRTRNVGAVVVVSDGSPVGLLTDRDIAIEVVARGRDSTTTRVGDVMKKHPTVIREDTTIFAAARVFSQKGVRRLPVVNGAGALVGIVSLDDLLMLLGGEMGQIAEGLAAGLARGKA
ncbi:MAG TPA: CBS domain-containing protein [Gemmatimonadales bacterium]|nr:CBS domain-containing protein [Gemmatimonadales bacterium]